jgi:hypothetical protein
LSRRTRDGAKRRYRVEYGGETFTRTSDHEYTHACIGVRLSSGACEVTFHQSQELADREASRKLAQYAGKPWTRNERVQEKYDRERWRTSWDKRNPHCPYGTKFFAAAVVLPTVVDGDNQ